MRDRIPMITALVCALLAMVATRVLDESRDPSQAYDAVAAAERSGRAVQFGVLGGAVGFALGLALRAGPGVGQGAGQGRGGSLASSADAPGSAADGRERAEASGSSGIEPWVWALAASFVAGLGVLALLSR